MIAHIAHPTTCDIACTHGTWILGSRVRILVHITWEQEVLPRLWGVRGSVWHRWVMSQFSPCKLTRNRKTVEETVWRDEMTTICRSNDLTVPPLVGCCLVGSGLGTRVWAGGVVCQCVLWVSILCVEGRSRYLYNVLGGYLHILGAPGVQQYICLRATSQIQTFLCCQTWISLDNDRFYEELCQPSSGSTQPAFPKNGGMCQHTLHSGLPDHCHSSTVSRLCHLKHTSLLFLFFK